MNKYKNSLITLPFNGYRLSEFAEFAEQFYYTLKIKV